MLSLLLVDNEDRRESDTKFIESFTRAKKRRARFCYHRLSGCRVVRRMEMKYLSVKDRFNVTRVEGISALSLRIQILVM